MTKDELAAELPDIVAILSALGAILPDRVDQELVGYLERASKGGVEVELLHAALSVEPKAVAKFKVR